MTECSKCGRSMGHWLCESSPWMVANGAVKYRIFVGCKECDRLCWKGYNELPEDVDAEIDHLMNELKKVEPNGN